jgi:hypothetical protein
MFCGHIYQVWALRGRRTLADRIWNMYLLHIPTVTVLSAMLARMRSMRISAVSMVKRLTAQLSASS